MCRYHYHYYAACRHQETVLFDFCANAKSLPGVSCASDTLAAPKTSKRGRGGARPESGEGEGSFADVNTDALPAACSNVIAHPYTSARSSFETGSLSITAGSSIVGSSLLSADPLLHSSPTLAATPHEMAGLPLFSGTLRHWIGSGNGTVPKQSNVDVLGHVSMTSKRPTETVSTCTLSTCKPVLTSWHAAS